MPRTRNLISTIVVLFGLVLTCNSSHADKLEVEKTFKQLRSEVAQEEGRLVSLRKRKKEIEIELAFVNQRILSSEKQRKALVRELKVISRGGDVLESRIASTQSQIELFRAQLEQRLVALYKNYRRVGLLDYLIRSNSVTELLKRSHSLSRVARYDRDLLDQLSVMLEKLQLAKQKLNIMGPERKGNLLRLRSLIESLEQERLKKSRLLIEQKEKEDSHNLALAKLKTSANEVEQVLNRMLSESGEHDKYKAGADRDLPFDGKGLAGLERKLPFPVEGKLVQRFGKRQHTEFLDILFAKGIEVDAPRGENVKAVAGGKVILVKPLPGYGEVIILDHGQRYYTLYGRLGRIERELGEIVEAGSVLAEVGEKDRRGRNFYFEIRYKGKARNPVKYFSSLPTL